MGRFEPLLFDEQNLRYSILQGVRRAPSSKVRENDPAQTAF